MNWIKKAVTSDFVIALLKRAVYTFAEAMLSMMTIGQAFAEIDWLYILSVSGVAAIIAVLRGIVTGLPEVSHE